MIRSTSDGSACIRTIPIWSTSPRWATPSDPATCAACIARAMAARPGTASFSSAATPVRSISRWIHRIRASSTHRRGDFVADLIFSKAAAKARRSGSRPTAAIPGKSCRAIKGCRRERWASSASVSQHRILRMFMRSSKRRM